VVDLESKATTETDRGAAAPVLEMRAISKRFGATQALAGVSLQLRPGQVHALLGENGAGKSTLIKIMTGVQPLDAGEILLDGQPIHLGSAQDAQRSGIAAMYQEPMIFSGSVGGGEYVSSGIRIGAASSIGARWNGMRGRCSTGWESRSRSTNRRAD